MAALALLAACAAQGADEAAVIAKFSAARPGAAPPAPWRVLRVPGLAAPEFSLVEDNGATVLRIHARSAAGSLAHSLALDAASRPMLAWRWKVDRVVESADLTRKEGDDYAARVYVSFHVPPEELGFAERAKFAIAKLVYGEELPAAAICYVWDNRHPVGTSAWNPYSSRLRMVVVDSGPARTGQWVSHVRDVEADFRAAFGLEAGKPVPRITGVAVAADTDQTRETVTAWLADLRLGARP